MLDEQEQVWIGGTGNNRLSSSTTEEHRRQDAYLYSSPQTSNTQWPHQPPQATTPNEARSKEDAPARPKIDLSPCHICHRKPTLIRELDAFASCEGCGKRTCWVCIRECLGFGVALAGSVNGPGQEDKDLNCNANDVDFDFSSERRDPEDQDSDVGMEKSDNDTQTEESPHRGMICSRCCVERGTEGEVWCHGCLRAESGG